MVMLIDFITFSLKYVGLLGLGCITIVIVLSLLNNIDNDLNELNT